MRNYFLLLFAFLATISTSTTQTTTSTSTTTTTPTTKLKTTTTTTTTKIIDCFIHGCKCHEDVSSLTKLKIFDCQYPITLTKKTFPSTFKLTNILYFNNVILTKIDDNAFNSLKDLETIIFKDSTIGKIESSAFDLPDMNSVSFNNVKFGELPILKSASLEELLFINCNLTKIPNLYYLDNLMLLNVVNNNIKHIDSDTFINSPNLEELYLTNNSIDHLPPNLFNNNSALITLYLDNNPIESFELNETSNLEYLSLKSCKLTTFNVKSSKNLDLLNYLDLSNNNITILPIDAFDGMTKLNVINLSYNNLNEIHDGIFEDNLLLDIIILDGNKLNKLPKIQSENKKYPTTYFSCKKCTLKIIDLNTFDNMPSIQILRLPNNDLKIIQNIFNKITSLKELDLSNNLISIINEGTFEKNTAIEILNLSGNPLKGLLPAAFMRMNALKKLDVSQTGLTNLWINHNITLPSLERLLIGNNSIKYITIKDLLITPNLKLLDIDGNTFKCNSDFQQSILWLIKKSIYPIQGADKLKTHESLIKDASTFEQNFDMEASWRELAYKICDADKFIDYDRFDIDQKNQQHTNIIQQESSTEYKITTTDSTTNNNNNNDEYYDEDYYNYDDENDNNSNNKKSNNDDDNVDETNVIFNNSILDGSNINLARASYILSVTSIFVLTALIVLTIAVTTTLLILKRQGAFNFNNENIPRLKIPLWNSTSGQKKHSGSVYKPLSEDLSGLHTPMINRYEFKSTPIVHNSSIP